MRDVPSIHPTPQTTNNERLEGGSTPNYLQVWEVGDLKVTGKGGGGGPNYLQSALPHKVARIGGIEGN